MSMVEKKNPTIGLIPATFGAGSWEFQEMVEFFSPCSWRRFILYSIDRPNDPVLFQRLANADIIHLGGGNTFSLLAHLRARRMINFLRKFVAQGGILTGMSAGAIAMTPSITTASFPDEDCDDNSVGLTQWGSLKLVPFEIFPHFRNISSYQMALEQYSSSCRYPIYAFNDGSGIVCDGRTITFHGKVIGIYKQQKWPITSGISRGIF